MHALGRYKVRNTQWGKPNLQGTWNTNNLQGVPMRRAQADLTRYRLSDDEYWQRVFLAQ